MSGDAGVGVDCVDASVAASSGAAGGGAGDDAGGGAGTGAYTVAGSVLLAVSLAVLVLRCCCCLRCHQCQSHHESLCLLKLLKMPATVFCMSWQLTT